MNRFYLILYLIVVTTIGQSNAQHWQGVALGNFAGTQSLYHNPAFAADSRYSVYANLVGLNYYVANNHVKWDAPFSYPAYMTNMVADEYRTDNGKIFFPRRYLEQQLNGNLKYIHSGIDLRLPSIQFSLKNGKYGLGFSTRARAILNVSQTTEDLARLIRGSTQDAELHGQDFVDQRGKLGANAFAEYSATFAGVLLDDETIFLKVGMTAKRLIGIAQNRIDIEHANYRIVPDPQWNNQRHMTRVLTLDGTTHYTTDQGISSASLSPNWWLIGKSAPGNGWGLDLGAVFEYRPDINSFKNFGSSTEPQRDPSLNKYLYRVAVSVTDIGILNFSNTFYNYSQLAQNARGNLDYNSFNPLTGVNNFYNAVGRTLSNVSAAAPTKTKALLPMALQASIDYQIKPHLYVGTLWVAPLTRPESFNMYQESVIAVVPRYERRWFEVSMPISVMNHYRSFGVGLAGRVGPLWFGTDHIPAFINAGKPKTFTFYAGLSMGIFRKPLSDEIPCWPPKQNLFRNLFKKN